MTTWHIVQDKLAAPMSVPGRERAWPWSVAVVCFAATYLWLKLFRWRGVPILLGGDQVFFWNYGQRVAHGQVPYRDFFQITPPGADYLYAGLFKMFGERMWVTDLVVLLAGVGLTFLVFELSREFVASAVAATLALGYLATVYSHVLNGTHHVFSMVCVGAGLLALFRLRGEWRYFAGGLLFGMAALFTQTHGVFAGLGVCAVLLCDGPEMWRRRLSRVGWLVLGMASVVVAAEMALARKVGWHELWTLQVVIPRIVSGSRLNKVSMFSSGPDSESPLRYAYLIGMYAAAPAVYAIASVRLLRKKPGDRAAWMVVAVGGLLLVEVLIAPNPMRVFTTYFPVFVALAFLIHGWGRGVVVAKVALVLLSVIAGRSMWITQRAAMQEVATPAGRVAAPTEAAAEKVVWLEEHRGEQDRVFEAAYPGVYLTLHTLDPLYAENVMPYRITPPQIADRAREELQERGVRYVVWNEALEADPEPEGRRAFENFREYVMANYRTVAVLANGERILERKSDLSATK
ncbi:MAG TPA: glycosyltransferase family 39 protein [Candidatus Koribacter sp.]|jgi:hypothetical protein